MADVSHELRTPLARIRVALELAAEDPVAAKDVLADVGTDLDEIDQLIADILTTARLDAEHATSRARRPAVGELAEHAVDAVRRRATPAASSSATIDGAERAIECDPVLLRRALDNLLDNAAKYSDRPPVTLAGRAERQVASRSRSSTRASACRPTSSSARSRRSGAPTAAAPARPAASASGLALARRIARAHGGDVTLASKLGQGTHGSSLRRSRCLGIALQSARQGAP